MADVPLAVALIFHERGKTHLELSELDKAEANGEVKSEENNCRKNEVECEKFIYSN